MARGLGEDTANSETREIVWRVPYPTPIGKTIVVRLEVRRLTSLNLWTCDEPEPDDITPWRLSLPVLLFFFSQSRENTGVWYRATRWRARGQANEEANYVGTRRNNSMWLFPNSCTPKRKFLLLSVPETWVERMMRERDTLKEQWGNTRLPFRHSTPSPTTDKPVFMGHPLVDPIRVPGTCFVLLVLTLNPLAISSRPVCFFPRGSHHRSH